MLSPESWSPDGKTIAYVRMEQSNYAIWALPLDGDRKARPLLESKFPEASPKFSPDGKWLAYCSNESGRAEVFVTELRGTPYGAGARIQVSTDGGTDPIWRRQGGELYYRSGEKMMAVAVATQPKLTLSKPHQLWEGRYLHGVGSSCGMPGVSSANYDVTGDGQRFILIEDKDQGVVARQINVVLNWAEELKRIAAGKKI